MTENGLENVVPCPAKKSAHLSTLTIHRSIKTRRSLCAQHIIIHERNGLPRVPRSVLPSPAMTSPEVDRIPMASPHAHLTANNAAPNERPGARTTPSTKNKKHTSSRQQQQGENTAKSAGQSHHPMRGVSKRVTFGNLGQKWARHGRHHSGGGYHAHRHGGGRGRGSQSGDDEMTAKGSVSIQGFVRSGSGGICGTCCSESL